MRLQRLVVGLLGAALLGAVPVALTTTSASAAVPSRLGSMSWAKEGTTFRYSQKIKISGQIQAQCGDTWCYVNEAGDSVKLYRQIKGSSTNKLIGTAYGDASGRFSFATRSVGSAVYRLKYSGGTSFDLAPSSQGPRTFKGSRHPHSKGVRSGGRLYYRGNVDPGWGHKPVTIQKKNCKSCGWHGYKTVRTSRNGGYSARIYAPSSGRWYFRSVVRATKPRFVTGVGGTIYTYRSRGRLADGTSVGIGG